MEFVWCLYLGDWLFEYNNLIMLSFNLIKDLRSKKKKMAQEFTDQNFEQEVLKSDKAVLVDFWAPWCGPCQAMGPIIESLAQEMEGKAKVGKLNVDENPAVSQEYSIMAIPSLKIFKGGQVVKDFTGLQNIDTLKEALEKI